MFPFFSHETASVARLSAVKDVTNGGRAFGSRRFVPIGIVTPVCQTFWTFAPGVKLVRRDGTLADAGSYANFFWLEPGDVAVFAAP